MIISDLFDAHVGKSHAFKRYDPGSTAFVTNGFTNNGIQGYVATMKGDKIFKFDGICISAFCEATVQKPPFLGRGNGGSGMVVLEPKEGLDKDQLLSMASYINNFVKWRFSYGRMVSKGRIERIEIPAPDKIEGDFETEIPLPEVNPTQTISKNINYKIFRLGSLFDLKSGDYHNASELPRGNIPLVSCGDTNNGVMSFVDLPQGNIYKNCLTIAYNGSWPMTAKYHPYSFGAKDDVAVCIPKRSMEISTLIFIQFVLTSETWRFSYGRKCFRQKLSNIKINLPADEQGELDEELMKSIAINTSYWNYLRKVYSKEIILREDIIE